MPLTAKRDVNTRVGTTPLTAKRHVHQKPSGTPNTQRSYEHYGDVVVLASTLLPADTPQPMFAPNTSGRRAAATGAGRGLAATTTLTT